MNFNEELAHIPLPSQSQYFSLIGRIPSFGKDLFDSRSRLNGLKGVCSSKDDVESICRANAPSLVPRSEVLLRVSQWGISVFNADAVMKEVDKNVVWVFGKGILDKVSRTLLKVFLTSFMAPSFKETLTSLL